MLTQENTTRHNYRPEIDGLRAVAVFAVIINHFYKNLLPSGFLGVDIFFVISGYVITSSLVNRPSESLKDFLGAFYVRRIKRLLPALITCISITFIVGSIFISPNAGEFYTTWNTGIYALFGFSNIYLFKKSTDYFAPSTELNLFTHTWSLGVEEQFYLIIPFLVYLTGLARTRSHGKKILLILITLILLISFSAWLYLGNMNQPASYFLMPARSWELSAGCLAFLVLEEKSGLLKVPDAIKPLTITINPSLIVALLFLCLLAPQSYAHISTPVLVFLTCLLIAKLKVNSSIKRAFTWRPVIFIGLISYSLYLWHWSILAISNWTIGVHWWTLPIQISIIFVLATISYKYIELPLRYKTWSEHYLATIFYGLLAALFTSGLIAMLGTNFKGALYTGTKDKTHDASDWHSTVKVAQFPLTSANCSTEADSYLKSFSQYADNCSTMSEKPIVSKRLFFVGDSHTIMLMPLESELFEKGSFDITHMSRSGCPFPSSASAHTEKGCYDFMTNALDYVKEHARKGDIVIVSNYYVSHFSAGIDTRNNQIDSAGNIVRDPQKKIEYYSEALRRLSVAMQKLDTNIVIVGPTPRFINYKPRPYLCSKQWFRPTISKLCEPRQTSKNFFLLENKEIFDSFHRLERELPNLHVYDPTDLLCSNNVCSTNDKSKKALYSDTDHLSKHGVRSIYFDFLRFLKKVDLEKGGGL